MFRKTPIALAIALTLPATHSLAASYTLNSSGQQLLAASDEAVVENHTGVSDGTLVIGGDSVSITVNGVFTGGEDLILADADTQNLVIQINENGEVIGNGSPNAYDLIDLNGDNNSNPVGANVTGYTAGSPFEATNATITNSGIIWAADDRGIEASNSIDTVITNRGIISASDEAIEVDAAVKLTINNYGWIVADGNASDSANYSAAHRTTASHARDYTLGSSVADNAIGGNGSTYITINNKSGGYLGAESDAIDLNDGGASKSIKIINEVNAIIEAKSVTGGAGTGDKAIDARNSTIDTNYDRTLAFELINDGSILAEEQTIMLDGSDKLLIKNIGTIKAKMVAGSGSSGDSAILADNLVGQATIENSGTIYAENDDTLSFLNSTAGVYITNSGTIEAGNDMAMEFTGSTGVVSVTNSGTIKAKTSAIQFGSASNATLVNSGLVTAEDTAIDAATSGGSGTTITNTGTIEATVGNVTGTTIFLGSTSTLTNKGAIKAASTSHKAINVLGNNNTLKLDQNSVIIGDIVFAASTTGNTLEMNTGAGQSYVLSVTDNNTTWTLTDKNGRTAIKGSAKSAATGNVETADEMLGYRSLALNGSLYRFQRNESNNSNFDFYAGNNKRTKAGSDTATYSQTLTGFTYINPSESSNLGLVIGYQNSDLSIQSGAQNLDSNTLIAGIHNATDNGHVKALLTYTKNKASQEVLDNTSSTGYTTYKGDYSSYGAIVGFGTAIKKDFGSSQNISLMFDADISHERISAWNETATFKWKARSLTQATANLKTEWRLEDEDSLTYLNAGVSARSLMSGKKADYSIDSTNTSFSGGDASSTALTLGLGHESKLSENSSAKFGIDASLASGERSVSGWISIESKF